jgi:hypothetical protein
LNTLTSLAGNKVEPERPPSPIESNCRDLEIVITQTGELAHEIQARLTPVLRAAGDGNQKDATAIPEEMLSPLPAHIRTLARKLNAANDVMRSILARAEI